MLLNMTNSPKTVLCSFKTKLSASFLENVTEMGTGSDFDSSSPSCGINDYDMRRRHNLMGRRRKWRGTSMQR